MVCSEVAGVPGGEGDADFALLLHAADAGPVPGARVDDHEGWLGGVDDRALGRNDADEDVVDRAGQGTPVQHHLEGEAQDVRCILGGAFDERVATLTQDIEREDRALPGVDPVFLEEIEAGLICHNRTLGFLNVSL